MSDVVLELLGKIDTKQTELQVAVKAAQEANNKVEAGQTEMKEQMEKASKAAESKLAQELELKAKVEAIGKTAEYLETSIARMGEATGGNTSELEGKAHDEMCRYLRHGTEFSPEIKEAIVIAMTEKAYHGLSDSEREHEVKALIEGSNPDGGYWLRPERLAKIVTRIFETSPVRQFASTVTTATNMVELIIDDEEADTGGWVGEVQKRDNTGTPQIGKLSIPVHEQFAQPLASQDMIDDAGFDLEAWVGGKVSRKMSRFENTAFVVGNGSQKPKGFMAYVAWAAAGVYERDAIEQFASGAVGDVTSDAFKEMQNGLIEDYQAGAIWAMKRASFANVITLKDPQGRYIFESRFINNRDEMRLLGKQVVFMNDIQGVANNALSYAYGDFAETYTIVDRMGIRVLRDALTQKPFIKFYTTKRVGGAITNFEALKIMKIDAS